MAGISEKYVAAIFDKHVAVISNKYTAFTFEGTRPSDFIYDQ